MALKIPGKMQVMIQCLDKNGQRGSFLRDAESKIQFGETYVDLYELYKGHEIKFCKAHEIEVI